jgi:hypothetical protein
MHVFYDHPPRTLSFYIRYVLLLIIIILPILIIVPLWTGSLPLLWKLGLLLGVAAIRLLSLVKPLLVGYTILEDTGLPKDTDISHLELPVPDTLADVVVQLEMEGFERLGEYESYVAGVDRPVPVWIYRSSKGQIIAQITAIGQPETPFIGLTTVTEKGIVETTYPRGHQLRLPKARFSGVRSNLQAAYRHHIQQVRDFTAKGERIVIVESVAQYFKMDRRFAPQFKVRMGHILLDRVIAELFLTMGLVPGFLLFATWFMPEIMQHVPEGNHLYSGFFMLVIGLIVANTINLRSRGVAGPKQPKIKS